MFSIILVSEINCTICFLLHQMSIWFYRFTSRLLFRNIVAIWSCAKGGKFRKNSLATLETFEDWKTVLGSGAHGGRGSASVRGHHNSERTLAVSKSSAVATQSGCGSKNRDLGPVGGAVEVVFHDPLQVSAFADRKALALAAEKAVRRGVVSRLSSL